MKIKILSSGSELGGAAAAKAAELITSAIKKSGSARIIAATGNSQIEFITALTGRADIDWSRVEVLHMDEYVGLPADHPASFRRWIKERIEDKVRPSAVYYIEGDAPDIDAECRRYAELLVSRRPDIAFVGIGENGHIAFNDPHEADFMDAEALKRVTLDDACRRQQVGEGHFRSIDDVPQHALTMTCPALMFAEHLVCAVPDRRKAQAVKAAVEGPVSPACPASLLRTHAHAFLYLDRDSASLLSEQRTHQGSARSV